MKTFSVRRISDGVEVYRYQYDAPIDMAAFPAPDYMHFEVPTDPAPEPATVYGGRRTITRIEFLRLLRDTERVAIRTLARTDAFAEDFVALLDAAPEVHLDDADVARGLSYLTSKNCLTADRVVEVLRG